VAVHESAEDVQRVQELLDRSYASAGPHLRGIHTENRRLPARELVERLTGMRLLVVATVNSHGAPVTGPVDGVFHRGDFYFGTDPSALRWRHLQRNSAVSATHLPVEEWAVTVHGHAVPVDVSPADPVGLRATLIEIYSPRYGADWAESFLDAGPVYARIDAERMFTFSM
jgi:uncharacterized pyridoxamine 5'-phosphate oxidase family protein